MPTTSQSQRAAAIAALPEPVATSSTRAPGTRSAASAAGGGDGGMARAGGDVEHAGARDEIGRVGQPLGDRVDAGRDGGVVAAGPHPLLPFLDALELQGRAHSRHSSPIRLVVLSMA